MTVTIASYRDDDSDWLEDLLNGAWIAKVRVPWDHPVAVYRSPVRISGTPDPVVLTRRGWTRRHAEARARRAFERLANRATMRDRTKRVSALEEDSGGA